MGTQTARIQLRRDSLADWTSNNPTLAEGEAGFETDSGTLRIGDNSNAFLSLPRFQPNDSGAKSADYTVTDIDGLTHIIVTTGSSDRTVTLPTAADNTDRVLHFIKADSGAGTLTIDGEGAETISGDASVVLASQYNRLTILCDGTSWHILTIHASYTTGWINRSDWTNVHMGSDDTKNADSNVTHNLGVPLRRLKTRIFVSTDGTDANSRELNTIIGDWAASGDRNYGIMIYAVDDDNIKIQTGGNGIFDLLDTGLGEVIDTEDWYYNIIVERMA